METVYITTEEAATILGVSAQRVRALIRVGRLKARTVGEGNRATYLIQPGDLDPVKVRKPGRPPKVKESKAAAPKAVSPKRAKKK